MKHSLSITTQLSRKKPTILGLKRIAFYTQNTERDYAGQWLNDNPVRSEQKEDGHQSLSFEIARGT